MKYFGLLIMLTFSINIFSQESLKIMVKDSLTLEPLIGATAYIESTNYGSVADTGGVVILKEIPRGKHAIVCSFMGYNSKTIILDIPYTEHQLVILLSPAVSDLEEVTVSVTRSNSRLENSSVKVEVLGKDDMDEENTIKPGNVTSLLGDVSGIQLQQSSAISGNTNVRIQGLDGKYTQILRDGLPLYEGYSGGFGIMQVPPLDLKQIEIIKGSASTLYGGGAISGIINFVSKEPGSEPEGIITLNQSSLTETNVNAYYSKRKDKVGMTFFSGITRQNAVDINKDGFSDVPELYNMIIHPRFFFYFNQNSTLSIGLSSTYEKRTGGDMQVIENESDSAHAFFESNESKRYSADVSYIFKTKNKHTFSIKASSSLFDLTTNSNTLWFGGKQLNSFGEISYLIPGNKNDFIFGFNYWGDKFMLLKKDTVKFGDYNNQTIGAFAQNTFKIYDKWFIDAGIRADYHNEYGSFLLPSASALYKINKKWNTRLGFGFGYKTPEIFNTGIKDISPYFIIPLNNSLKSEKSYGANMEFNYTTTLNDKISIYVNQTFFYTEIESPIVLIENTDGYYTYINANKPIITKGSDTYFRASMEEWELYLGYTYTLPLQTYDNFNKYILYTPLQRAAATLVYEIEGKWRFGLEYSYNGFQYKEDNSKTKGYSFVAAMVEKKFKFASIVLNCENLLDFRQTKYESIIIPPYNNPSFKTLWAPIDGRVINLSVVFKL